MIVSHSTFPGFFGSRWIWLLFLAFLPSAQASTPTIVLLDPPSALASVSSPAFPLTVNGYDFDLSGGPVQVSWNGVPLPGPTTFDGVSNVIVSVPGINLNTGADIQIAQVTVANFPYTTESAPSIFVIYSSSVDPATVQTVAVSPGELHGLSTGILNGGVDARYSRDGAATGDAAITVAHYSASPTAPGTYFDAGGGHYDVQVVPIPPANLASLANDSLSVAFYYPLGIGDGFPLQFWNPTANSGSGGLVAVLSSGSVTPAQDIVDGPSYGGSFSVNFDMTSTPKITELSGTVFTMAPLPLPAMPATLWPPNGKLIPVTVNAPGYSIISVSSNELQGGNQPDWVIAGPLSVKLRAARLGTGDGRIYTVLLQAGDGSQNVAVVRVPHHFDGSQP